MTDVPKPTPEQLSVVVAEDPIKEAKPGDLLRFTPRLFTISGNLPKLGDVRPVDLHGVCLAVIFADESGRRVILGSGVIVAPGLALSATHVIKDLLPKLAAGKLSMAAFGFVHGTGQSWRVRGATFVNECDVCFLQLEAACPVPPDRIYNQAHLTTRCPAIGESVSMFGFRAMDGHDFIDQDHKLATLVSAGTVRGWHMAGRDACMLPFPCVEVDCPTLGGMSGGPVFDSRGYLFAMITASMQNAVPEESSPTYASLLWPVLAQKVQSLWPGGYMQQPTSLLELSASPHPMCAIERPEALMPRPAGPTLYQPWS
jgi:hypothetical protein